MVAGPPRMVHVMQDFALSNDDVQFATLVAFCGSLYQYMRIVATRGEPQVEI